jgi:MFS family permease
MAVDAQATGEAPAIGRFAGALSALEVRDFRLLWLSSFPFAFGRGMQMVALSWLVYDLTSSAAAVGAVLFAQGIPLALFSLPAGVWADRVDRRLLLIVSQAVLTASTAVLAVLILVDVVAVWSILVLAVVMGIGAALGQPSRQALVPALVGPDRLMNAIVLNNMMQNLSTILGPAAAGGLLATVGTGGTFVAQVVILCLGLPWLFAMRSPPAVPATAGVSIMTELREGLAYVVETRFIRLLFIATAFIGIFFAGIYQALLPVFAREVLDVGAFAFTLLSTALGVGMFAGAIFIASRGDLPRKGDALLWSLLIASGVVLVFAFSRWYPLSLLMMLGWGVCAAFFMNLTLTLIQKHTPDRLMGRVMSAQSLAFMGMNPIGNLQAGALAEWLGAPIAASIGAVVLGVVALWLLLREPELRAAS